MYLTYYFLIFCVLNFFFFSLQSTTPKETSSPRLQHRVPIFAEGYDQPIHSSSVDSMASVPDKKPNVRVIPIEVEGADTRSPRHRTYSGPADTLADRRDNLASERIDRFPFKRYDFEDSPKPLKPKLSAEPRVYNIPIQVEGANTIPRNTKPRIVPTSKVDSTPKSKDTSPNANNGCQLSKSSNKSKCPKKDDKVQPESNENKVEPQNYVEIALKKIEDILTEFKAYETGVVEFTGTSKDKQFRYLDEMLTRCMLRLDDIDTMGNEEIRLARKNAVKKVQASIDLLESKTNVQPVSSVEVSQEQSTTDENLENNDVEMKDNQEMQDSAVTSTESVTSSEIKVMDLTPSDNTDLNKANDTISNSNVESKVEPVTETLGNTNNITNIEMNELSQEKADDEMQDEDLTLHQENSVPEEISLDKVNSTNDVQSSELCESNGKNTAPIEALSKSPINDVDMSDDSIPVEVNRSVEESSENTDINKSSENEVEMVDVQDISSETSENKECEIVKKSIDHSSECPEQKINNELNSNDTPSLKDDPKSLDSDIHESGDKCTSDLPEHNAKCASSQSDKDKTLKTDVK